jgi:hypothetical protein
MKKIIVLSAVIAATIMSCAKDNTCTCTVTSTPSGGGTATSSTTTYTLVETTKGQAKANCLSGTQTLTYGAYSSTSTHDCKLN